MPCQSNERERAMLFGLYPGLRPPRNGGFATRSAVVDLSGDGQGTLTLEGGGKRAHKSR